MAEACMVSQDNSRRCLPAWMLKPCSSNEVSKTQYRNEPVLESDKQGVDLDQIKPVRRKRVRQDKTVDAEDAGELGGLQPCQGLKKARRKCVDAVKDDHEESARITTKNARKVSGRSAPKNSRKRKLENVELEAPSETIDDDIELTVEDLVSIAEEYVKADKAKRHEVEATKTARYNEHRPSISTKADSGGSIINARSELPETTTKSNTAPSESSRAESNKQQVQCRPSFTATGDVAQDMLNIFFGPLLSKCSGYEKKSKAVESLVESANHATEKKESANRPTEKNDLHSDIQKQVEPAMKKKSSLKDKVPLFL
ncbi:uncharacterized protein LOC102701300 [Oryza brachyantha]|uniref:Uncharacterized protein n=1 Tax=Oryza brachyantha TaxID=4533 RepID=J3N3H8_ORYBR|nr:uncharacterized protein LOC102701300 [Oryza brachyantha]XP_015697174.1 uncharacterized protein LOC102701300 [Oryza brachyantha]XP_015697175.1 uncharacterized protein LOC102701300 [Oryza brachyantha]